MSRSSTSTFAMSVAALAAAALIACSTDRPAEPRAVAPAAAATAASGATTAAGAVRVSNISNLKLESFTIKAGTTVQFNNLDGADAPHALVGDKGEFDSKGPINGFKVAFDRPGVINYHCTIHPTMTGTITVQ